MGKESEQTPPLRRCLDGKKSVWKDVQYHMSLGYKKLRQWWDTTTHLLKLLKSKPMRTPISGENVVKRNVHVLLVGMQNSMATLVTT